MFRKTLCAALILAFACRGARGQSADDDAVVLVARGQTVSMTLTNLAGVSVGDVNVGYILERRGDRVVIMGAGAGETSIEFSRRGAGNKVLKLRVVPVADAGGAARTPSAAATSAKPGGAGSPTPTAPPPASPSEPSGATPKAPAALTHASASPAAGPAAPAPDAERSASIPTAPVRGLSKREVKNPDAAPSRAGKRPGLLSPSRIEVTVETSVSVDRETYRPVDAEAVTAQAREAAGPGAGKRPAEARSETASALRANSVEVRRSSVSTPVTIRYEIDERSSVALVLPLTRRVDEVKTGGETFVTTTQGLGDLQLNFTREYPRLRKTAWAGSLDFNVGLPTAKSIYDAKADEAPLGIGHLELGSVLGVRRVFDPLVFNAAFGLSYLLPRTVDGKEVKPGLGQTLQTGVGYALNDRWVFSEQLYYARRPNYFLNVPTDDRASSTEQAYLSHGLILNPKKSGGHTLRLSFNLGLTNSSTDYGLGFSYSFRRKRTREQ